MVSELTTQQKIEVLEMIDGEFKKNNKDNYLCHSIVHAIVCLDYYKDCSFKDSVFFIPELLYLKPFHINRHRPAEYGWWGEPGEPYGMTRTRKLHTLIGIVKAKAKYGQNWSNVALDHILYP
jgi:hypothetical protein